MGSYSREMAYFAKTIIRWWHNRGTGVLIQRRGLILGLSVSLLPLLGFEGYAAKVPIITRLITFCMVRFQFSDKWQREMLTIIGDLKDNEKSQNKHPWARFTLNLIEYG